ncbi:hypothetical protein HMI56_005150 [Coelomomyces lativittatus]|nr:hypothetical protein HMI56_005150 [Coelomomyces lativittatus]
MVPSGLIHPHCVSVIGNGVVVHLPSLFKELETLKQKGIDWENRVVVSDRAHVVLDVHQVVDGLREQERGGANIGTTRKGIGPAYSSKSSRSGFRIHQLFEYETFKTHYHTFIENRKKRYGDFEYDTEKELMTLHSLLPKLKPMVKDTVHYFHEALHQNKKKILVEGANAAMLDIDFGSFLFFK